MLRSGQTTKFLNYSPATDAKYPQKRFGNTGFGRDLFLGMSLLAWVFIIIQSLQFAVEGVAADFGPGMALFDWIYQLTLRFGAYGVSVWTICVSDAQKWGMSEFIRAFLMWQIMIAAMMVPTLHSRIKINPIIGNNPISALKFLSGYFIPWALFSVPMVIIQWLAQTNNILNNGMMIKDPVIGGAMLLIAGCAQVQILRHRPSDHSNQVCSKSFYKAGFENGIFCVKNSWPLMMMMFVFGLMNVIFMGIMTIAMLCPTNRIVLKVARPVIS